MDRNPRLHGGFVVPGARGRGPTTGLNAFDSVGELDHESGSLARLTRLEGPIATEAPMLAVRE